MRQESQEKGAICTDQWKLIIKLCDITEMSDYNGTEWTETRQRGGKTYTRTVKKVAAMAVAVRLLQAANAGTAPQRADLERGRQIVKLAQWHVVNSPEGRKQQNLPKSAQRSGKTGRHEHGL